MFGVARSGANGSRHKFPINNFPKNNCFSGRISIQNSYHIGPLQPRPEKGHIGHSFLNTAARSLTKQMESPGYFNSKQAWGGGGDSAPLLVFPK